MKQLRVTCHSSTDTLPTPTAKREETDGAQATQTAEAEIRDEACCKSAAGIKVPISGEMLTVRVYAEFIT